MTPKEIVTKNYECFNTGDMETFVSLYDEEVMVKINGMHRFSGTYNGIKEWMDVLSQIPSRYDNFSVTPINMIAEDNQVFSQILAKADRMEADFGHFHKIEKGKIKEFWVYDDSQKMAHTMKAI